MDHVTTINVRATRVDRNEDGTYAIEIPSRPLTMEEHKLIIRLFPHQIEVVHLMLDKECLLGAIE
jgi:hypothetical protein